MKRPDEIPEHLWEQMTAEQKAEAQHLPEKYQGLKEGADLTAAYAESSRRLRLAAYAEHRRRRGLGEEE